VAFPSTLLDADAPLDAVFVRDVIAGNVLHGADCAARYFVNWMAPASGVWGGGAVQRYIQPISMTSDPSWNQILRAGPFPLTVREDGTSYPIRVKVRGARSGGAGDVTFAVGVGDESVIDHVFEEAGDNAIIFEPFTSTTPAWGVPEIPASNLIQLTRAQVDAAMRRRPTIEDTGGTATEVELAEVYVFVWAKTTDTTNSLARLHGLEVAEYVG
jgi:hypothetical protein